jgi:hypothetical protein
MPTTRLRSIRDAPSRFFPRTPAPADPRPHRGTTRNHRNRRPNQRHPHRIGRFKHLPPAHPQLALATSNSATPESNHLRTLPANTAAEAAPIAPPSKPRDSPSISAPLSDAESRPLPPSPSCAPCPQLPFLIHRYSGTRKYSEILIESSPPIARIFPAQRVFSLLR